jgi:hypothetical protein
MITIVIIAGVAFLLTAALVVGIVDAMRSVDRREAAAERREKWEERVLELHGGVFPADEPDWDDD